MFVSNRRMIASSTAFALASVGGLDDSKVFAIRIKQGSRPKKQEDSDGPFLFIVTGPTGAGKSSGIKQVVGKYGLKYEDVEQNLIDNIVENVPAYKDEVEKLKKKLGEKWTEFTSSDEMCPLEFQGNKITMDPSSWRSHNGKLTAYKCTPFQNLKNAKGKANKKWKENLVKKAEEMIKFLKKQNKDWWNKFLKKQKKANKKTTVEDIYEEYTKEVDHYFKPVYQGFSSAYFGVRKSPISGDCPQTLSPLVQEAWKQMKNEGEKNHDNVNDKHLELCLTRGKNVIFETTGEYFPDWLLLDDKQVFAQKLKEKNYKIVFVEAYVDNYETLQERMWNRFIAAVKDADQVARLPNCTKVDFGPNLKSAATTCQTIQQTAGNINMWFESKENFLGRECWDWQASQMRPCKEMYKKEYMNNVFAKTELWQFNNSGKQEEATLKKGDFGCYY